MAHTINDDLHSDLEDRVGELAEIKHFLFLLSDKLEKSMSEERGTTQRGHVTLSFSRESLEATVYLASESWRRAADLHERLYSLLNDSVSDAPQMAQAA